MSDPTPSPSDSDLPALDRGLVWGPRLRVIGVVAAFLAVLAAIPAALGFGPFGVRLVTSEEIPVHVLNVTGEALTIELSFAAPVELEAGTIETLTTLSGPAELRALRADGSVLDDLTFDADRAVFYNAGGGECFVVFDISGYYDGDRDEGEMRVVARLDADTRVYAFEADTVVLPRRVAPDQARGTVHWIEPVGCDMLAPDEERYLIGRSQVRLQHRREQLEEARERAREQTE